MDENQQADPLLSSVCFIAQLFEQPVDADDLLDTAGVTLPVDIRHIITLADQAGLVATPMAGKPDKLFAAPLPILLLRKSGGAWVITHWQTGGGAIVVDPLHPDIPETLSLDSLAEDHAGQAFGFRLAQHMDRRTGEKQEDESSHGWFWDTILLFRRYFPDIALAATLINLFGLATALFVMQVYDRVVPNLAFETLWVLAIGVIIVAGFDFGLRMLRGRYIDLAGAKADQIMTGRIFSRLIGRHLDDRPASTGATVMAVREYESVREFLTSTTVTTLIDFPFVILFIIVIAFLGGPIALVPALAVPLIVAVGISLQRQLRGEVQRNQRQQAHRGAVLVESMTGLEAIKARAAEGQMQHQWETVNDASLESLLRIRHISSMAMNFTMSAYMAVYVLLIVWGVYQISEGDMSLGSLIACAILLGRTMAPLSGLAALIVRFSQSRETLARITQLIDTPMERPHGKQFTPLRTPKGDLALRDVEYAYQKDGRRVVDHISLSLKRGERVGVIGPIGCGKTTLARLLATLYNPTSGSLTLDGMDIRQFDPAALRRLVGYVEQAPQLFFGTVRDNIVLGHRQAEQDEIMRAAETAGVLDFLGNTPQGLEIPVSERGDSLSGGQRQAICIARALLRDPPILVLDEPTSAMDPMSEERFKNRLAEKLGDRTLVLFTHRGSLLSLVDRVIVMADGKLVADGPKDAVLKALREGKIGGVLNRGLRPSAPDTNEEKAAAS